MEKIKKEFVKSVKRNLNNYGRLERKIQKKSYR